MSDFIKSRPQRLCLMCGRCCKVATTPFTHNELLAQAQDGDESTKDFLSLFEPYESIDKAREVCPEIVDNILKTKKDFGHNPDETTFYRCKYIQDNNLCGIYEKRLEVCDRFPSTTWAVVPPGCGFEGWLFQKKEEVKKKIRHQKECLIEFEAMLKILKDPEKIKKLKDAIEKINKTVELLAKYGAKDW